MCDEFLNFYMFLALKLKKAVLRRLKYYEPIPKQSGKNPQQKWAMAHPHTARCFKNIHPVTSESAPAANIISMP